MPSSDFLLDEAKLRASNSHFCPFRTSSLLVSSAIPYEEEALRCLSLSRSKLKEGNKDAAIKFAKKSLALYETAEAKAWLESLTAKTKPSPSTSQAKSNNASNNTSSSAPNVDANLRSRPKASSSTNSTKNPTSSSTTNDASSSASARPYTTDQVQGIARIKSHKQKGDLYAVLGLTKGASEVDIKKAYRKLALMYHPDKCSAPGTDEAFKAIGHAFGVLGDDSKRKQYDQFGIDANSPSGGGGAGGASGMNGFFGRNGGGHGARFESEIDPEELFRMFFQDIAGGGGGGNGFRFTTGHGAFPTAHPFFEQARFRRAHQHTSSSSSSSPHQQQTASQPASLLAQLIHLLPLLLIALFSLVTTLFPPDGASSPFFGQQQNGGVPYALHPHHPGFTYALATEEKDVPYWIPPRYASTLLSGGGNSGGSYGASKRRRAQVERAVEEEYLGVIRARCMEERERKRREVREASGGLWGLGLVGVDEARLRRANKMVLASCEEVQQWPYRKGSRYYQGKNNKGAGGKRK